MGQNTTIGWTKNTWNPWYGCIKVSPGCKNCYMYRDMKRHGRDPKKVTRSKTTFNDPLKWKEPTVIFTCSWSDFMIEQADAWRPDAWKIIRDTPHHTYQILTKRTDRIELCLPPDWGPNGYPNVWLGTSIESEKYLYRKDELVKVPAAVHFLSLEPLLGGLPKLFKVVSDREEGTSFYDAGDIEWVIIGGESGGSEARRFNIHWAREIIMQCKAAGVPVFMKQLGRRPYLDTGLVSYSEERPGFSMSFTGMQIKETISPNDPKGEDWNEWPPDLRVQEFPIAEGILA